MNVYLLSGLGADYRAFKNLILPIEFTPIHIVYEKPEKIDTLESYAKKITDQIDYSKPFHLIGLSFGGILAMELLDIIKPTKTIIISSVCTKYELPISFRLAGFLKLNKLIPPKKVNKPNLLTYYIFGIKEKKHKELLKEILTSTNTEFSKWAVNEIVNWKRKKAQPNTIRIHGTNDRLLPMKKFKADYIISKGGHLLIVQNGEEVSKIVENILKS